MRPLACWLLVLAMALAGCSRRATIGSKAFTESVILGEIAAELARGEGAEVRHQREINGTRLVWDALVSGQIDVYPEYTGTLTHEIFAGQALPDETALRRALASRGIEMTRSLGFNDTYAIGMRTALADRLGIRSIADLRQHPELRLGFSSEFLDRADGWPALRRAYDLTQASVTGLEHNLAYRALAEGSVDVTDLYSTDAEIDEYHFRVLDDVRHFFPEYQAVYLFRSDLRRRAPDVVRALQRLEGRIDQAQMIAMNRQAKVQRQPESSVAAAFLARTFDLAPRVAAENMRQRVGRTTWAHLGLVVPSLLAAIPVAVLLGIVAAFMPRGGQGILAALAVVNTIPSLALLVFMLPLAGIGWWPAVLALFLYSLMPIARNTHAGLRGIPAAVRESAAVLGLPAAARVLRVDLPLAAPAILAGIQTAAVWNIGTATLGALIGAGGYGQPILTGIRLNNFPLILEGAVPAALMALLAQVLFDVLERFLIPRGLRLAPDRP